MKIKIFTKPDCPKCPAAETLGRQLEKDRPELMIEWYDVAEINGMTEAAFYGIQATPSILITDDKGEAKKSWRGEVPTLEIITENLKSV